MPRPRKFDGPEGVPKKPAPGRRNRQWPKQERALPDGNFQEWGVTDREPDKIWGEDENAWAETGPTGWGTEGWQKSEAIAWRVDDWALEAYTTTKIEAWRQQVEACPRHELVRTPSATSEAPAIIDIPSLEPTPPHSTAPKLHRWALNFLNQKQASANRRRLALSFLKQPYHEQLECIRRLIEEIRRL